MGLCNLVSFGNSRIDIYVMTDVMIKQMIDNNNVVQTDGLDKQ